MARAKNLPSVDWTLYFRSIRKQCPWSYVAWNQGLIDIAQYQGVREPLQQYHARIYVIVAPDPTVEAIAHSWDYIDSDCEWLFSYPGYGDYATPVSVLIQQHRQQLNQLRDAIANNTQACQHLDK